MEVIQPYLIPGIHPKVVVRDLILRVLLSVSARKCDVATSPCISLDANTSRGASLSLLDIGSYVKKVWDLKSLLSMENLKI